MTIVPISVMDGLAIGWVRCINTSCSHTTKEQGTLTAMLISHYTAFLEPNLPSIDRSSAWWFRDKGLNNQSGDLFGLNSGRTNLLGTPLPRSMGRAKPCTFHSTTMILALGAQYDIA